MDGQPVIPELGAALIDVLADPRLGLRAAVEIALLDSEDREGELDADARGSDGRSCSINPSSA